MVTKKTNCKDGHRNRGLSFEKRIQNKCDKLKEDGIALISKVPTEFRMIRGAGGRVVSAYPVGDSRFVDFIGTNNRGESISIEAKETKNKTSFPFSNIKDTQFDFFELWNQLGGKGFYIIHFKEHKEVYFIKSEDLKQIKDNIGRKSIPYDMFVKDNRFIKLNYDELDFEKYI